MTRRNNFMPKILSSQSSLQRVSLLRSTWAGEVMGGATSMIFLGKDKRNRKRVCAIKVAKYIGKLDNEIKIVRTMSGLEGFPTLIFPSPSRANGAAAGSFKYANENYVYYVMSLAGPDFLTLLVRGKQAGRKYISLAQFGQWVLKTEKAIRLLHSKGIIHKDINDGNVCVNRDDTYKIVLIDYDLAVQFDVKAEIDWDFTGPQVDYDRFVHGAIARLSLLYADEPFLRQRFPIQKAIDQQIKLYGRTFTEIDNAAAILILMIDELAAVKKRAPGPYANLKKFQEQYVGEVIKLIKQGPDGNSPWFPDLDETTNEPLTRWSKDTKETVAPISFKDGNKFLQTL